MKDYQQRTQSMGYGLIWVGVIGLAFAAGVVTLQGTEPTNGTRPPFSPGAVAAAAFFLIMLGMAFVFPSMLRDENKALSTMRVLVFMVISVFVILSIKTGWDVREMRDLVVDDNWLYIIGLCLGGKVAQKFSEMTFPKPLGVNNSNWSGSRPIAGFGSTGNSTVDPPRGFDASAPDDAVG